MKIIIILYLFSLSLLASVGEVTSSYGDVTVQRDGKFFQIRTGSKLLEKDVLHTQEKSHVKILFNDKTVIALRHNSIFNIEDYIYDKKNPTNSKANFQFLKGAFSVETGDIGKIARKRFKIKTTTSTVGIRGTMIVGNQKEIACVRGEIDVTAKNRTVIVSAGMMTAVSAGYAPTNPSGYTQEQLEEIAYFMLNNSQDNVEDSERKSSNIGKVKNIYKNSNVKHVYNSSAGVSNKAKQSIHTSDTKNGRVRTVRIDGEAKDVSNISSGTYNSSAQSIGSVSID